MTSSMLGQIVLQKESYEKKSELQSASLRMFQAIKTSFAQAIDLEIEMNLSNMNSCCGTSGKIVAFDSSSWNSTSSIALAQFWRETSGSTSNTGAPQFTPTALFYQPATISSPGVLYLDLGEKTILSPGWEDVYLGDIVSLKMTVHARPDPIYAAVGTSKYPNSVDFEITLREFFQPPTINSKYTFCIPSLMNAFPCATPLHYKDSTHTFQAHFRNVRDLRYASTNETNLQGSLGSIHFFTPVFPRN